jgi:hypothetical protein
MAVNYGQAFSNGIEMAGDAAGVIAEGASDLYQGAIKYGTDAFDWIEKNPETAQIIAGVVGGAGQYFAAKEAQKANERFQMSVMDRRRDERQIKPGEIENYGSHVGVAKKGLLTNGMIAGGDY